ALPSIFVTIPLQRPSAVDYAREGTTVAPFPSVPVSEECPPCEYLSACCRSCCVRWPCLVSAGRTSLRRSRLVSTPRGVRCRREPWPGWGRSAVAPATPSVPAPCHPTASCSPCPTAPPCACWMPPPARRRATSAPTAGAFPG